VGGSAKWFVDGHREEEGSAAIVFGSNRGRLGDRAAERACSSTMRTGSQLRTRSST
jgi:hypothetical protein